MDKRIIFSPLPSKMEACLASCIHDEGIGGVLSFLSWLPGCHCLTSDGIIVGCNEALQEMTGYATNELVGMAFKQLFSEKKQRQSHGFLEGDECGFWETQCKTRDGQQIDVELSSYIFSCDEKQYRLIISTDFSETRFLRQEIARGRSLIMQGEILGQQGVWSLDAVSNELIWDKGTRRILGVSDDYQPTNEAALAFYHPDDLESIVTAASACVKDGRKFDLTLRMVNSDGRMLWTRTIGEPQFTGSEVTSIFGLVQDISNIVSLGRAKQQLDAVKMTITSETASLIGEDFFSGLLRNLAEGNRASCALIATINETEKTASTIAVYSDGAIVGGIEYPLADTPCENLLSSSECFYKSDVKNLFPKDLMLQEMGAEFYAGSSLVGSGGELLGIMVLIGDAPIEEDDVELIRSLFSFVTGRVTAELERQSSLDKYTKALRNTVQALVLALEQRDSYTAGHQRNVASISCEIAGEMGLSAEQIDALSLAASIHDIGKISIPAEILNRAGRLSDIELELVKTHSQNGYDILKDIELPWDIAEVVLQHHERIDGSGYPGGLKADQIHLGARIIAVADVVDAMTTHRPYRAGLGLKKAEQEIERGRGTLYDEEVVAAYFRSRAS